MKIGVPKEIKPQEGRVALLPVQVENLAGDGQDVFVQAGAGLLSGISDQEYSAAGATIL